MEVRFFGGRVSCFRGAERPARQQLVTASILRGFPHPPSPRGPSTIPECTVNESACLSVLDCFMSALLEIKIKKVEGSTLSRPAARPEMFDVRSQVPDPCYWGCESGGRGQTVGGRGGVSGELSEN